jgi:hypothetical protein
MRKSFSKLVSLPVEVLNAFVCNGTNEELLNQVFRLREGQHKAA